MVQVSQSLIDEDPSVDGAEGGPGVDSAEDSPGVDGAEWGAGIDGDEGGPGVDGADGFFVWHRPVVSSTQEAETGYL